MFSILYVDDEPTLLELGKIYLERSGSLQVDTILSAGDAIKKIENNCSVEILNDEKL